MQSAVLANIILIVHALYIGIVVLSVPLILLGGWRRWRWVRNPWYRFTHLAMIGIVVAESLLGVRCPLTVWENAARATVQATAEQDFIALWLDRLLFYQASHLTFITVYTLFGLMVAALFVIVPVRHHEPSTSRNRIVR